MDAAESRWVDRLRLLAGRPRLLQDLPVWARYALTAALVALFAMALCSLDRVQPFPFLMFLPAVVIAAVLFDRGSGFLATLLSAALAIQLIADPRSLTGASGACAIAVFALTGVLLSALIEALRSAIHALGRAQERIARGEREAREAAALFGTVIDGMPDPVFVKDREGRFVRANRALATLLGVPPERLAGRTAGDFLPAEVAAPIAENDRRTIETASPVASEEAIAPTATAPVRWHLSRRTPWRDAAGEVVGLVGISQDIDERRRAEEALSRATDRRRLLLEDINHRVRNHLQSVIAMLSMTRNAMADETARAALDGAARRLSVLARVYDRLEPRGPAAGTVEVRAFLESLVREIEPALVGIRPLTVSISADPAGMATGRAVALGLLVNEALTNAVGHAFPCGRSGTVSVSFRLDGAECRLEVADDGVGRPPLPEPATGAGLGTLMMRSLARQLDGTVEWSGGEHGTRVVVAFPLETPAAAAAAPA